LDWRIAAGVGGGGLVQSAGELSDLSLEPVAQGIAGSADPVARAAPELAGARFKVLPAQVVQRRFVGGEAVWLQVVRDHRVVPAGGVVIRVVLVVVGSAIVPSASESAIEGI
jgi:hypothetical protein